MDYSPPGSSVHGIFQARILERVAISYSRGPSPPRDQTHVSCICCIGRQILYHWNHRGSQQQFSSVAHLCPTLCDPMNLSTPGLPVHHQLLEFTQTHEVSIGAANRQISLQRASLLTQMVKNSPAMRGPGLHPWVGKISWRREWLPTPIFLPGEFQGQRRLVGYSPWGHKMWDMTEQLSLFFAKKLTFLKFFGLFFKIVKRWTQV